MSIAKDIATMKKLFEEPARCPKCEGLLVIDDWELGTVSCPDCTATKRHSGFRMLSEVKNKCV